MKRKILLILFILSSLLIVGCSDTILIPIDADRYIFEFRVSYDDLRETTFGVYRVINDMGRDNTRIIINNKRMMVEYKELFISNINDLEFLEIQIRQDDIFDNHSIISFVMVKTEVRN